jgi:hypothetical protein
MDIRYGTVKTNKRHDIYIDIVRLKTKSLVENIAAVSVIVQQANHVLEVHRL